MQKKLLWLLIPIGLLLIFKINTQPDKKIISVSPINMQKPQEIIANNLKKSIFVPYWASKMNGGDLGYDTYYYFGILPSKEGKIENEVGFKNMSLASSLPTKQKKLVLRMLDLAVTEVLLEDKTAQKMLISEVKSILSKNAFSGLILDIEVPFTLQANKKEQITQFVQLMCTAIKADYKTCGILIYGDFAYRNRPYDMKKLGEAVDTILLMAYDFHKAGGEPGPNFPFARRSLGEGGSFDYGYDFKTMTQDVVSLVPKEKIEVVFGMYGYDWTLNEQGTPLKSATAISVKSVKLKAESLKLKVKSNSSKEKNIQYTDEEGRQHIIWYEDEESSAIKIKYLQEQGVFQVSFWAWSYF